MDDRCRLLREALGRRRSGKGRWRCPPGLRSEVVAYASDRRAEGESVARIAVELGLSEGGLRRWLRSGEGGFREVRIAADPSSSVGLVLVTPRGFRLEGLSEALALRFLREL